jgi:TonB family protein
VRHGFQIALLIAAGFNTCALAQQIAPTASHSAVPKGSAVLVSLFDPVYPPLARQANITGKVSVTVTVDKDGTTAAVVESGHPLLRQAALDSATQSHFECREWSAPLSYLLVYTFEQTSVGDCCSAFNVPPRVERESPTTDAQGQPLTHITIATGHVCLCDPSFTVTKERVRSLKCLYLWRCTFRK